MIRTALLQWNTLLHTLAKLMGYKMEIMQLTVWLLGDIQNVQISVTPKAKQNKQKRK